MAKIMSVDDSALIRNIIGSAILTLGYESISAENGEEALNLLESEYSEVKLILLDWIMPKLNGYDTLLRIKSDERFKHIPVIMVTTESERDRIIMAIQAGARNFIIKPFNMPDLISRIKEALEEEE